MTQKYEMIIEETDRLQLIEYLEEAIRHYSQYAEDSATKGHESMAEIYRQKQMGAAAYVLTLRLLNQEEEDNDTNEEI